METTVPVRGAGGGGGGGHKIQADALNDDINVTAICDVHTSLKSRFPVPPPPLPSLFRSCLSLFWLSWSQLPGKKWRNGHKESKERERERRFSLFTSTFRYRHCHAFSNVCNRQLAALLLYVSCTETQATSLSAAVSVILEFWKPMILGKGLY